MPILSLPPKDKSDHLSASAQLGVELGVLIAGLRVSDEVKESLLILMDKATPQQLIALREALAHALLMESTRDVEQQYEQKLRRLVEDFKKQQSEIELEADKDLELITQELKAKQATKTSDAILI